jgi:hypothetical protein
VLESAGAFSFGGPTFPATRVSELELTILTDFERLIASTKGLVLPPAAEEPIS